VITHFFQPGTPAGDNDNVPEKTLCETVNNYFEIFGYYISEPPTSCQSSLQPLGKKISQENMNP
jgi:hypothetical protein